MKTKVSVLVAAVLVSAANISASGQSSIQRIQNIEDSQAELRASIDSLSGVISLLGEGMETITDGMDDIVDKIDAQESKGGYVQSQATEIQRVVKRYSEIVMGWVCLLIFAVFLPLLLVKLYKDYTDENKRRYDIVVDLLRSGVEISPEVRGFIIGEKNPVKLSLGALRTDLDQNDLDYCIKRIVWGFALILFGFALAIMSNAEVTLFIFGFIGLFFIAQAAICYFRARGAGRQNSSEDKSDADKA